MKFLALAALLAAIYFAWRNHWHRGGRPAPSRFLSRKDFTEVFAAAFREAAPDLQVTVVEPLALTLEQNGASRGAFLANAYQHYRNAPDRLPEILRVHVAAILEHGDQPTASPLAIDDILPILKPRAWLADIREQLRRSADPGTPPEGVDEHPHDEWLGDLVIVYAEDHPNSLRYVTAVEAADLPFPRAELRARAVENLRRRLGPGVRFQKRFQGGPHWRVTCADPSMDASLLLLDECWTPRNLPLAGEPVAAVPSRDLVLVADGGKPADVALLRQAAANVHRQTTYDVSPRLLVRRDGQWRFYE